VTKVTEVVEEAATPAAVDVSGIIILVGFSVIVIVVVVVVVIICTVRHCKRYCTIHSTNVPYGDSLLCSPMSLARIISYMTTQCILDLQVCTHCVFLSQNYISSLQC